LGNIFYEAIRGSECLLTTQPLKHRINQSSLTEKKKEGGNMQKILCVWSIVKEFLSASYSSNLIQVFIALFSFAALVVLWLNLSKLDRQITEARCQTTAMQEQIVEARKQATAAQDQLRLSEVLNQPLCGIKELKVEKVRDNVVQISPLIKNFGKMVEKDASFQWKIDQVENFNDAQKRNETPEIPWSRKQHIKILPEQEIMCVGRQYNTKLFNELVRGFDSALLISMIVEYHNADNKPQKYSCSYRVTRLASLTEDKYEVMVLHAE
jgi:hypothetical protein